MTQIAVRGAWAIVVLASGLAQVRGLLLTTHFQLTPQAHADAVAGRAWLWGVTVVLVALALVAYARWQVGPLSLIALVASGPVGLVVQGLGWFPLVALLVSGPLLLVGLTGVLLAPPRTPDEQASA